MARCGAGLAFERLPRWVIHRKQGPSPVGPLPVGDGGLAARVRDKLGTLHELVLVDVPWAVRKNLACSHPNDELRLRVLRQQWIVPVDACDSVEPETSLALKVNEE